MGGNTHKLSLDYHTIITTPVTPHDYFKSNIKARGDNVDSA